MMDDSISVDQQYQLIATIIAAQNANFESIKRDEKKHTISYDMAVGMIKKFLEAKKANFSERNWEIMTQLIVSYMLWPSDITFIANFAHFKDYILAKDANSTEITEENATDLVDYYGNDKTLPFLRMDFLLKKDLKEYLQNKDEEKAYNCAQLIVKNENLCRSVLGIPLESDEAKSLTVSYLLIPDDDTFKQMLNKWLRGEIKTYYLNPELPINQVRELYLKQNKHNFKHFEIWELINIYKSRKIASKPSQIIEVSLSNVNVQNTEKILQDYQRKISELEAENAKLKSDYEGLKNSTLMNR